MTLIEFMAWIGGIPTILTTMVTLLGIYRIFKNRKKFKSVGSYINEMTIAENSICKVLLRTKPINRWLFRRQVGREEYLKLYLSAQKRSERNEL
jgi:hypothetical protein